MEAGALMSTLSNKQWPQQRLHKAGLSEFRNCRLCVAFGHCDPADPDPKHSGTLLHRLWVCPVLEEARQKFVPRWLLSKVRAKLALGQLCPADLLFYTRAVVPPPEAARRLQPKEETFVWDHRPLYPSPVGTVYIDGSLLFSESKYFGLAARRGWAVAIYSDNGDLMAAAHGRPPAWAAGIHGAELWSLLMAINISDPADPIRTDCMAVLQGSSKGLTWAGDPTRMFARAWGPVCNALADTPERLAWMPAHCGVDSYMSKRLSNGKRMSRVDWIGNRYVDELAKDAAKHDKLPRSSLIEITRLADEVTAVAMWIGRCTALANHFPLTEVGPNGKRLFRRDSDGLQAAQEAKRREKPCRPPKRKAEVVADPPGILSKSEKWLCIKQRILERIAARDAG